MKNVTMLFVALATTAAHHAHADIIATMEVVGNDVVVSGGGTVNLDGAFKFDGVSRGDAGMNPSVPSFRVGADPSSLLQFDNYATSDLNGGFVDIVHPDSFGTDIFSAFDTGTGDRFGVHNGRLHVPHNFVSGSLLSFSGTIENATLASVGATPGTYVWSWGTGANEDTFTLNIVPAPASASMLGLAGLCVLCRRRG